MNKSERSTIRFYLGEWGRLIRVDGTRVQWGTSPLAAVMGGSEPGQVEDPVMERVAQCMAQVRKVYPQLYRFQWGIYVKRQKAVEVADAEGCSKRYVHQWLARGEEYLAFFLLGSSDAADQAAAQLDEYYQRKAAQRAPTAAIRSVGDWDRPVLTMPPSKNV